MLRIAMAAAFRSDCSSTMTLETNPRLPYAHSRTACGDGISAAAARSTMRDSRSRDVFLDGLELPRGLEREVVIDGDHRYELNGEDSRTLAAVGAFRVVAERDLRDPRRRVERSARAPTFGTCAMRV